VELIQLYSRSLSVLCSEEQTLADNSGGVGVLGVLVGVLIVIVIAGGLVFMNGKGGSSGGGSTLKVELPKSK
jgi:hypothetical protein